MQSVGETMSFGTSFCESLQKGLCSLETGLTGLNKPKKNIGDSLYDIEENLLIQSPERILYIAEALRNNFSINKIWDKLIENNCSMAMGKSIRKIDRVLDKKLPYRK